MKKKETVIPETDLRIQYKFLWLPKSIAGQTKWLWWFKWEEARHKIYKRNLFNLLAGMEPAWSDWKPTKWL